MEDMRVLTSGIGGIDQAVGGGVVRGSSMLFIYDSFSLGWMLPFMMMKHQISEGTFVVIINYNLPLHKLILRARSVEFDIEKEGKAGNLAVIDVFGSRYSYSYPGDYVYRIEGFNPETYIPKLEQIYREIFKKVDKKNVMDFVFSLDGMAFELGEGRSIKLIRHLLSNGIINGRHLFSIYLLNRDRVSLEFLSWNIEFSDYILEFSSKRTDHEIIEHMYVLKSPLLKFEPGVYVYDMKRQGVIPQTSSEKLRPESLL
ncbi:hypothetical protein E3E36_08415 [Thermococcus sp. M36]|uniref:RAD55 family ATPase n=1 Tax=Thermococcus sp. M36 TaxID=1638261 RepID=UPI00143C32B8|nr:hypothetical protein [Thermococcus sp. M36]NJE06162.1 hypothetical protein [Thermococcus sp. M36]